MNPQPDPIVGNIVAAIFVLTVVFYTAKAIGENNIIKLNDKFIIGYVQDYTYIETPIKIKVTPRQSRNSKNTPQCVIANEPSKSNKPKKDKPTVHKSTAVSTTHTPTTTTPPPKPKIDEQLYNDCISSLVALGYKKTEAKNKTKQVFDKHTINSIQDFIRFVTINTIDLT